MRWIAGVVGIGLFGCAATSTDIVIYGGTSAGIAAAIHASRIGKTVVLIAPGHLGGMTTSGLGATDIGNKAAIGGIAREFYRRVRSRYNDPSAWTREAREAFPGPGHDADDSAWTFEPKVATRVFREMLDATRVRVVRGERLDLQNGVEKRGARIVCIATESGRRFPAKVFIDATYEGDLLATAGVSFRIGREANHEYGETLNGTQTAMAKAHQFFVHVDPWRVPRDPSSGLLPGIRAEPPAPDGSADALVQAYCFRLCTTDHAPNRRPWPKPLRYDETAYELLLRNFEAGDHRIPCSPTRLPNRKTDTNNNCAVSTDWIGNNWSYPTESYAGRAEILARHTIYQKGLMWTLANHPRVPARVRRYFQTWGLAKDEFVDTDNWPPQLYVREARRMVSDYVMTERHCRGFAQAPDSIGLAAYGMDSHNVQRYVTTEGAVRNEGDVEVHGFSPYPISYRSITPKPSECTNLLVPVCVSATHIAFGSIRMEPVFMVLGQSAATAASLAIDENCAVQDVTYRTLRRQLRGAQQVLDWRGGRKRLSGRISDREPGIVKDDSRANIYGDWTISQDAERYFDFGYRHDGNAGKGDKKLEFKVTLLEPGRYEVRLAYHLLDEAASNVPVTIRTNRSEPFRVQVDQRKRPPIDGTWVSLGVWEFDNARRAVITVGNEGTDGTVNVDAIVMLRRP